MSTEIKTSNQWEQLGTKGMEEGNFVAAINCFKQVLAQKPDDCQTLYKLGKAFLSQGAMEDALRCFDKLLNQNPNDALAMAAKGSVLKYLDRTAEGKVLCQRALELEPKSEEVLYIVGETFLNDDDSFGKEIIDKLLAINHKHAKALYLMGLWQWFRQKPSDSKKYLSEAVSVDGRLKHQLYSQVHFYKTMKLQTLGLTFLDQCLDFDRDNPNYHTTRGELLLDQGRTTEALQAFREAEAIDPNDLGVQYGLGCVYFAMGNPQAAFKAFSQTIELEPEHPRALTNLAAIYCDVFANYPKALEFVNRALEYDEKLTTAWVNRGIILSHIGDLTESISSFDKALAVEPDNTMAMLQKGGVLNDRLRLHDEAIKLFNKAARIDPNNPVCWWNLSQAFMGKNDFEQAIQYLDKVLEVDPTHRNAMANKGILLWRLGRNREARQAFMQLRQINPLDPRVSQALQLIPEQENEGISGQLINILKAIAQTDSTTQNYLKVIAKNSDRLLATIFVGKMQEFFASDEAKQMLPDVATLAMQELRRVDTDTLITWLVKQGAAQILQQ
jgi:tetratricopeptide (TPR) repeat protein